MRGAARHQGAGEGTSFFALTHYTPRATTNDLRFPQPGDADHRDELTREQDGCRSALLSLFL